MSLGEALSKRGGLTLSQLASYDDLITDALIDHVRVIRLWMHCRFTFYISNDDD